MEREERLQIEFTRVFCIVAMMWVHVTPGLGHPSYINGGPMAAVGDFFAQTMGRISVTTLSFVSGFLFWRTGLDRPTGEILRRQALAIYAPMLVWNAIYILLAVGKEVLIGSNATALDNLGTDSWALVNAWTGLAGGTANQSLFFIRDLVVATVIILIISPAIRRVPLIVLPLALIISVWPDTRPLLFRPTIFTFMCLGAIAARLDLSVWALSAPRTALTWGFGLTLVSLVMALQGLAAGAVGEDLFDMIRRAGIGFLILAFTRAVVPSALARKIATLGRHSFLAYLCHTAVIGVLWVFWRSAFGDELQPTYLGFFLATPFVIYAMAVFGGKVLDRSPAPLQMLLRGKILGTGQARLA